MTQLTQEQLNEKLLAAVEIDDIEAVKTALEQGADVNARYKWGYTPLHEAAWNGHTEIIELLLKKGADVNAGGEYGNTPIKWASRNTNFDIVELLKQHGAV